MDLHLTGKRALVTGASRGLGYATALGLAREGCQVVINSRNPSSLPRLLRPLPTRLELWYHRHRRQCG